MDADIVLESQDSWHDNGWCGAATAGPIMILARMEDRTGMSNDDRLFSWGWIKDWQQQHEGYERQQHAA